MKVSYKYFWKDPDKILEDNNPYQEVIIEQHPMKNLGMQWQEWEERKTSPLYPSTHCVINMKEVFMGDLINIKDVIYEVVYGAGMFSLDGYDSNGDFVTALGFVLQDNPDAKIVGHEFLGKK